MNIFKLCLKHKAKVTFGTLPNGYLMITVVAYGALQQQQLSNTYVDNTPEETQFAFIEHLIEQCKERAGKATFAEQREIKASE